MLRKVAQSMTFYDQSNGRTNLEEARESDGEHSLWCLFL